MNSKYVFIKGVFVSLVVGVSIPFACIAENKEEPKETTGAVDKMSVQDLRQMYDRIEETLIKRLRSEDVFDKVEMKDVIEALGYIRSEKAIPHLVSVLEFSPKKVTMPDGTELLVKASTYEGTYPAMAALKKIGSLSPDQIIGQIEKSKDGSEKEALLVRLGYMCHEKNFVNRLHLLEKSDKAKWERVLKLCGEK